MIRRPPRSTQSRSSAASDVYKRQVQLTCGVELSYRDELDEPELQETLAAVSGDRVRFYAISRQEAARAQLHGAHLHRDETCDVVNRVGPAAGPHVVDRKDNRVIQNSFELIRVVVGGCARSPFKREGRDR